MMAAQDRTLLANLGFNDPDKKDPLHDLGCQYIAQPQITDAVIAAFSDLIREKDGVAKFEDPVSKGQGQYKTTIGFLDVVLPGVHFFKDDEGKQGGELLPIFVEVKITQIGLGDILRQINLYREYRNGSYWILAAAFEMSSAMADGLRAHNILPIHLGENFRKWAAEQRALPRATDVRSI